MARFKREAQALASLNHRASLAILARSNNQVGGNRFFEIIQGIAYLRKHASARRLAEELRDSEQIAAGIDLPTKVIHEIKSVRLA